MILSLLPLSIPLVLLLSGLVITQRPQLFRQIGVGASGAALGLAAMVAGAFAVLGAPEGAAWTARLDLISAVMLPLVTGIGWVVLKYATVSLRDEVEGPAFVAWLLFALAAVLAFVMAPTLFVLCAAWVALAICVRRLFLTFPDRPIAQAAARKYVLSAGLATAALITGSVILAVGYDTAVIAEIKAAAANGVAPAGLGWGLAAFALAAVLSCALFPLCSWLTEAMEAPTAFSALLHAGIVNAGGVLLLIFADLLILAPGILAVIAMAGGASALIGALVMLTQPAIKTSLAWSTVSQMGFLMLQIGLALFPLALLHIVAHALYKAHALLNSGTAVATVTRNRAAGPVAVPSPAIVGAAFALALGIYGAGVLLLGAADKAPQALALGMILILGIAYLMAQGMAGAAPKALTLRLSTYAAAATVAYLSLQTLADWIAQGHLPAPLAAGWLEWAVIALAIGSFTKVAAAQALLPHWAGKGWAQRIRVHLSNGLYAGPFLDRALGAKAV